MRMKTFPTEDAAEAIMRNRNRAAAAASNYRDITVLVDGPVEGEFTVMDLREAIAHGFTYRWEA